MPSTIEFMQEHYRFLTFWITNTAIKIKPNQLLHRPEGQGNHLHWLLGHITTHMDMVPVLLAGEQDQLPQIYRDLFQMGSHADPEGKNYPLLEDMIAQFRHLGKHAVKSIARLKDEDLAAMPERKFPPEIEAMFPNKGAVLKGNGLHLAYHHGQMNSILSLLNKDRS